MHYEEINMEKREYQSSPRERKSQVKNHVKDHVKRDEQSKKELNREIGRRLKQKRFEHEYTQEEMAVILNISTAFYGKIERGENGLTPEKQKVLIEQLGMDMNYLLTGEDKNSK